MFLSVALSCIAPAAAGAADNGFYVGIDAGQSQSQLDLREPDGLPVLPFILGVVTDASSDRRDATIGLNVGYEFSKHFAVELAYADLGEARYTTIRGFPGIPSATLPGLLIPFPGAPRSSASARSGLFIRSGVCGCSTNVSSTSVKSKSIM